MLLWSGTVAIFSLVFVAGSATQTAPLVYGILLPIAVVALVLPVRGVHQRIAETKRRELARLSDELSRERKAFEQRGTEDAREAAARRPALIALRAQVEAAREWPFDVSTYLRFTLYVTIGLGSWLGGAIVERGVDAFLG